MSKGHKRAFIVLVLIWLALQFIGLPHLEEIVVDLAVNTLILYVMLSPYSLREAIKLDDARKTFAIAVIVVCVGQLLCIVVQIPAGFVSQDKGVHFLVSTVVLFFFWILEAEAFCRWQFKGTIKEMVFHWKSLFTFVALIILLTLIFHLDNIVGGIIMERMLPNGMMNMRLEVFLNIGFDRFVRVCEFAAYYKVLSMVVYGIKRIE